MSPEHEPVTTGTGTGDATDVRDEIEDEPPHGTWPAAAEDGAAHDELADPEQETADAPAADQQELSPDDVPETVLADVEEAVVEAELVDETEPQPADAGDAAPDDAASDDVPEADSDVVHEDVGEELSENASDADDAPPGAPDETDDGVEDPEVAEPDEPARIAEVDEAVELAEVDGPAEAPEPAREAAPETSPGAALETPLHTGERERTDGTAAEGRTAAEDVPPTAAAAFDELHDRHAPSLTRQAFLLCGHRGLARRAVTHAFRLAWQRWPEVAVDADPAGWVRAATYRYALAPWRHFRLLRLVRHRRAMRSVPPRDRTLLDALLRLPNSYRAPLLLCDGLGLSLADTAAEVEAGTAATAGRLRHARAAIAGRVPELADAPPAQLPVRTSLLVRQLAAPQPASPPPARIVRRGSNLRTWCSTTASLGLVAVLAGAAFAVVSSDDERNVSPRPRPQVTVRDARAGATARPSAADDLTGEGAGPPVNADGPVPSGVEGTGPVASA